MNVQDTAKSKLAKFFFKAEREKDKEGWYKLGKKTYRQSERCSYENKWLQGEETSGLDTERV